MRKDDYDDSLTINNETRLRRRLEATLTLLDEWHFAKPGDTLPSKRVIIRRVRETLMGKR